MKAQISIEMIIILAVLLTLVLVVATKLQQSATEGTENIETQEHQLETVLNATKPYCQSNDDCTRLGYTAGCRTDIKRCN